MIQTSKQITDLFSLFEPIYALTPLTHVRPNAFRLDAGSYVTQIGNSLLSIIRKRPTEKLGRLGRVFGFGPFKRTYITPYRDSGIPLLTSAEMMEIAPEPSIMSKVNNPKWKQYQVERGWILVSCSGTIGNVTTVPQYWHGWAVSQDAIRIVPSPENCGLVWAFLLLQTAKSLMVGKKSGSVIDHIYEADVANLDLPAVSSSVSQELTGIFERTLEQRELGRQLHDEAVSELLRKCALPDIISSDQSEGADLCHQQSRIVLDSGSYRLDAHFYNPTAQQAAANIRKCREVKTVGEVAQVIFTGGRIKRNYVESDHGVPFLSGKNIVQIRPTDLKYLSNLQMAEMPEILLKQSSTLITRSGTIGRTCFVWKNYEDYAGSEHILRVIPDDSKIDPGYLYAFLSSQYGYEQILRFRHGSVIDEITNKQIEQVLVPLPSPKDQIAIGDKVREAYEKRAEAIRLEDEAQSILMKELTKVPGAKGV